MSASKGLEGVVAAATTLSNVEGTIGRLSYRGYAIEDLTEHATFEEIIGLLWDGELPNSQQLARITADLSANRVLPERTLALIRTLSPSLIPIAALRTIVSSLAGEDPEPLATDPDSLRAKGPTGMSPPNSSAIIVSTHGIGSRRAHQAVAYVEWVCTTPPTSGRCR